MNDLPKRYVPCDGSGGFGVVETTLEAAKNWMDSRNPDTGDCVILAKEFEKGGVIASIRRNGQWHDFTN